MPHPFIRSTRSAIDVRNGRRDWFSIRNAAGDVAEISLYDEIGFFGITARDFIDELKAITAPAIALHINSPGGDVFDAVAIYNALLDHSAKVTSYVDSLAASAASFIALAGDRVVMAKHSQMMIHDAWGMSVGNAEDMRAAAAFLDKQSSIIADIYAERATGNKTAADWLALMAAETWFSDQEAIDAGLAHEIGSQIAAKNTFDLSVFRNAPRNEAVIPSDPAPATVLEQPKETPSADPDWRTSARFALAAAQLEV